VNIVGGKDAQMLADRYDALWLEAAKELSGDDASKAERPLEDLIDFSAAAFGRDHERTLAARSLLGRLLIEYHRADEAIDVLRHVLQIVIASPTNDFDTAESFFDLGRALDKSGKDTEAMDYYEAAYRIYCRAIGPDEPATVLAAQGLAEMGRVAHDYESAERWFRVALNSEAAARGRQSESGAHSLNNLAETLFALGRADEAAPLAEEALEIRHSLFGADSPQYKRSLFVVGEIALSRGDAERVSRVVAESTEKDDPNSLSAPVSFLLSYLEFLGNTERAIQICEQAIASESDHPVRDDQVPGQYRWLRFRLGEMYTSAGNWAPAKKWLLEAFESEAVFLSDELGKRSHRQIKQLLSESRARIAPLLLSLCGDLATTADELKSSYAVVQGRKSIETRLLKMQKRSFVTNPALTVMTGGNFEQLQAVGGEMNQVLGDLRDARRQWIWNLIESARDGPREPEDPLADQVEFLERRLASYVGARALDWELLGIGAAAPQLTETEVLIEFVLVQGAQPAYHAFVVGPGDSIHLRSLGDAQSIDLALAQLRGYVVDEPPGPNDTNPPWRRRAQFLSNRLLRPLFDLIQEAEKLYVAPDGDLFTLPFDLLPVDEANLLIDRWALSYVWHGSELNEFTVSRGSPSKAEQSLVVSSPAFSAAGEASPPPRFEALPFADREGVYVAEKLGVPRLQGLAATKDAVLTASSPEVIHLATHSFYIPPPAVRDRDVPDTVLYRARSGLTEPMERSGIALAGADIELNQPTLTSSGILFASEVLDLDLRGTDLVVLSSCQSGLGDPSPGEGIQGLRRAFRAAGARTVVSSLWKVPDEATCRFMEVFYDRLLAQVPRGEALREAKKTLRDQYRNDPLFWAGFVLDGVDSPLYRFDPSRQLTFGSFSGIEFSFQEALDHIAHRKWDKALHCLELVLDSPNANDELIASAAYEKAGVLRKSGRLKEALDVYNALIHDVHTPAERVPAAVADRGLTRQLAGDLDGAYLDYTSAIHSVPAADERRSALLVNRGAVLSNQGKWDQAIADCDEVLADAAAPADQRVMAALNRADYHRLTGRYTEARLDAIALTEMPEAQNSPLRPKGFLLIALCDLSEGKLADAIDQIRLCLDARGNSAPKGSRSALRAAQKLVRRAREDEAAPALKALIVRLIQ
jgi:CHAT domain-containing protein